MVAVYNINMIIIITKTNMINKSPCFYKMKGDVGLVSSQCLFEQATSLLWSVTKFHSQIVIRVDLGSIWDLGGLVVHSGGHTESSEEPESSAQPRQRLILADVRGEAVDAGLREGRAVVPHQLVVRREGLVGDDVATDGETHAGALPERCGRGACAAAAEDAGPRCG